MNKPNPGEVFEKKKYWWDIQELRESGSLPEWAHDFISIHFCERERFDNGPREYFSYISPMLLVTPEGRRPGFEDIKCKSKKKAIDIAKRIAVKRGVHIVCCC